MNSLAMDELTSRSSELLAWSGALSGWVSIVISAWSLKINSQTNDVINKLQAEIVKFRRQESERVDKLIQTVTSLLKQKRKK
jgi:hypothetical protein